MAITLTHFSGDTGSGFFPSHLRYAGSIEFDCLVVSITLKGRYWGKFKRDFAAILKVDGIARAIFKAGEEQRKSFIRWRPAALPGGHALEPVRILLLWISLGQIKFALNQ